MTAVDRAFLRFMREKPALVGESGLVSTTLMQIMDLLKPEDGRINILVRMLLSLRTPHSVESFCKDQVNLPDLDEFSRPSYACS